MTELVVFHGTAEEARHLTEAVDHNCQCEFSTADGRRTKVCPPHLMMISDQRQMNGLLYARRLADRLKTEEWSV